MIGLVRNRIGGCAKRRAWWRLRRFIELDHLELFGKSVTVPWKRSASSPAEQSAACRQYLVAFATNRVRRERGWTIEQLAEHVGMGAESLRRRLRGEVCISWIDAPALGVALPDDDLPPESSAIRP